MKYLYELKIRTHVLTWMELLMSPIRHNIWHWDPSRKPKFTEIKLIYDCIIYHLFLLSWRYSWVSFLSSSKLWSQWRQGLCLSYLAHLHYNLSTTDPSAEKVQCIYWMNAWMNRCTNALTNILKVCKQNLENYLMTYFEKHLSAYYTLDTVTITNWAFIPIL